MRQASLRVLIVAEHASARFGGEAILPLHYFRGLRQRGIETWLVAHARTRDELFALLPDEIGRMHFVPDTFAHRLLHAIGRPLPASVRTFSTEYLSRLLTQFLARRIARHLIRRHAIDLLHQPIPVSPRETSLLHGMGVPVVIGPMNGGMDYPPDFRHLRRRGEAIFLRSGRWGAALLHHLMPGKRRAAVLLVANERTRRALPAGCRGQVRTLVENGVDLNLWHAPDRMRDGTGVVRFIFIGRLLELKGVDLLISAMEIVRKQTPATLDLIGDGVIRADLQAQVNRIGLSDAVRFHGWMAQAECARMLRQSDVFVLPSLHECGGAVVLEAMACALPVIVTRWGGPADYVDDSCGILIPPAPAPHFIQTLADTMLKLAQDPTLRRRLGNAARQRAVEHFDWNRKIDAILGIYRQAIDTGETRLTRLVD